MKVNDIYVAKLHCNISKEYMRLTSQEPWPIASVCVPGSPKGFSAMRSLMADAISWLTLYGVAPLCCIRSSTCSTQGSSTQLNSVASVAMQGVP